MYEYPYVHVSYVWIYICTCMICMISYVCTVHSSSSSHYVSNFGASVPNQVKLSAKWLALTREKSYDT